MATIPFLLGTAYKAQPDPVTPPTFEDIGVASAIDESDGAVLGDPRSGTGETGISVAFLKEITEKAVQTGSFTRDFGNLVGTKVDGLSMSIPLKGNGATATPADSEYDPAAGILALYRSAGLFPADWAGGNGREFTFASAADIAAAVYMAGEESTVGQRALLSLLQSESCTLDFTPGEVGQATFALAGVLDSMAVGAGNWNDPPFDYGTQSSLSAPAVENAAFTWGARTYGFENLTITIDNQTEEINASNVATGKIKRQTGRTVTITAKVDSILADVTQEFDQLGEASIANAVAMSFAIGTPAGASDEINAYRVEIDDPELQNMQVEEYGGVHSHELTWVARSATANAEMSLIYV